MALSYKIEGDKLIVEGDVAAGVDQDQDGEMSLKGSIVLKLELDGSEVAEEILKSSSLLQKIKDKLGMA